MNELIGLMLPVSAAAALAWLLTPATVWLARRTGAIDQPGPRRVHDWPIPRLGGLAVVGSFAAVLGAGFLGVPVAPRWLTDSKSAGILLGLLPILIVSVVDDVRHVKPWPKFGAQVIGAGIAIWFGVVLPSTIHLFGVPIHLGWAVFPVSALWIVGVTNAFNLVDGLDGLAAGLGLIAAASLAAVMLLAHNADGAAVALVLCGAILGFLPLNLHPASVFLGDCGAASIGYLLACLALTSSTLLSAGFAILIPVIIIGVPLADTVVSIVRRTIVRMESGAGNRIYEADGNHIHHRLLALGLSHQRAVSILHAVGAGLSLVALASLLLTYQQSGLLLLGVLLAGLVGVSRLGYGELAFIRRGVALRVYDLPVMQRAFFTVFVDMVLAGFAVYLAVALKYDAWFLTGKRALVFSAVTVLAPIQVGMFSLCGVYRGSWRVAGIHDFVRLNLAIFATSVLGYAVSFLIEGATPSASLLMIFAFVDVVVASGSRISFRILEQTRLRGVDTGVPTIIYGAGRGGLLALRELTHNPGRGLRPVGFLDDYPSRKGKSVDGYPVLGTVNELGEVLRRTGAKSVVVSSDKIASTKLALAAAACQDHGARLLSMGLSFDDVTIAPNLAIRSAANAPDVGPQPRGNDTVRVGPVLPETAGDR